MEKTTLGLQDQSAVPLPAVRSRFSGWVIDFVRRSIDICVSLLGIIFLSPGLLFIVIRIRRDSPGPVFYRGRRAARLDPKKHNKEIRANPCDPGFPTFEILKFRTMYECPESYQGPKVTARGDSRITPFGRWLRDTKLNELPQLWNVLKGEMSLVGPRPEDPEFVAEWPEELRGELLSVRPGITSPASVIYHDEETLLQSNDCMGEYLRSILPDKLRLDSLYIRNRTLLTDLDVVFWTLLILLPKVKSKSVPVYLLYWGPLARFFKLDFRWFLIDAFVALMAVAVTGALWRSGGPFDVGLGNSILFALFIAFLFGLINSLMGTNRVFWSQARPADAFDLVIASVLVTGVLLLVNQHIFSAPSFPAGMLVVNGVLALVGFVSARYRDRILLGLATYWLRLRGGIKSVGERVLVVGAGEVGRFATWLLHKSDLGQVFSVVGMVDDDPRKRGMRIDGYKVIGATEEIPAIVRQKDIGLILFSISRIGHQDHDRILALCKSTPARTVLIPDILDILHTYFSPDHLDPAGGKAGGT